MFSFYVCLLITFHISHAALIDLSQQHLRKSFLSDRQRLFYGAFREFRRRSALPRLFRRQTAFPHPENRPVLQGFFDLSENRLSDLNSCLIRDRQVHHHIALPQESADLPDRDLQRFLFRESMAPERDQGKGSRLTAMLLCKHQSRPIARRQ